MRLFLSPVWSQRLITFHAVGSRFQKLCGVVLRSASTYFPQLYIYKVLLIFHSVLTFVRKDSEDGHNDFEQEYLHRFGQIDTFIRYNCSCLFESLQKNC